LLRVVTFKAVPELWLNRATQHFSHAWKLKAFLEIILDKLSTAWALL
jgi:hypothetical protein